MAKFTLLLLLFILIVLMRFITLTSDWNNDDFYVAAVKGLLYSKCNDIIVADITHKIESYKYTQAAFLLKHAFTHFPKGTIHIVALNSDASDKQPVICIQYQGHYFIGSNNGIFSLMFPDQPEEIVQIAENNEIKSSTFPELTLFAEAAASIINHNQAQQLGPKINARLRNILMMPTMDENIITGNVVYIDSYQNLFTNISSELFEKVRRNRKFSITVKSDAYCITKISNNYGEVEIGEVLAIFNSLGLIEIAMRNARMAELIDIRINSPVIVKFV